MLLKNYQTIILIWLIMFKPVMFSEVLHEIFDVKYQLLSIKKTISEDSFNFEYMNTYKMSGLS